MNIAHIINEICRNVAELPDRNSPDDQPDMMLVTADELAEIVRAALIDRADGERPTGEGIAVASFRAGARAADPEAYYANPMCRGES